ncbi:MAG TPA: response regulator transcription factor, partial [Steroidobacteraceae bacterium]|nr:response regulator transcription factor [Steroidobacteraceae bacterium]
MKTARILVADDHELFRRGLAAELSQVAGWTLVAEAANGRDAVTQAAEHNPDVVVLDLTMPELNGLDAARAILAANADARILILTAHESEQLVREVLSAGARGYVLKSDAG